MDEKHKKLLQKNHKFLVNNITNVEDVCAFLVENEIIEIATKEEIMNKKPAPHRQINHLLDLITRCGPKAFNALIQGFSESKNQHIVDHLMGNPEPQVKTKEELKIPTKEMSKMSVKEEPKIQSKGEPKPSLEKELNWPLETDMVKSIETCDKEDPNIQLQGTTVYNMTSAPKKGKVLMFKNYGPSIAGSFPKNHTQNIDIDSTNVDQVFRQANFTTKTFKDKTKEDINRVLRKHTEEDQLCDFDCFCLFLLSVGDNPYEFHDKEQKKIPLNEIMEFLKDRPALKSKPKIIIVQTCCKEDWEKACTEAAGDKVDSGMDLNVNDDDLFVVCSTPEKGVQPWINVGKMSGSWFIQAFVHVFKNYAHQLPFLKLLEKVDDCLRNARYMNGDIEINRRVASVNIITKCDRKQLYFFPGIYNQPTTSTAQPGTQCQPTTTAVQSSDHEVQSGEVSSTTEDKDIAQSENKGNGDN